MNLDPIDAFLLQEIVAEVVDSETSQSLRLIFFYLVNPFERELRLRWRLVQISIELSKWSAARIYVRVANRQLFRNNEWLRIL